MSKSKTSSSIEQIEDKYRGITVSNYWHDNGEIDFTLTGKEKVLELFDRLPTVYESCRKIGITAEGYVAYQNPIGDVIFYGAYVTPSNAKPAAKKWWVERELEPRRSYKNHPVGNMWYKSPE